MLRNRLLFFASAAISIGFSGHFVLTHPAAQASGAATAVDTITRSASAASPAAVSDVVAKALAFKALLPPAQQAVLEQPYTATLARRWSNLPCAATCRNGIQLGSLNAEQLAAALEVIRAAAGTSPNEGSDEFSQIRLADTNLANNGGNSTGGPSGAFSYGEGFYYLAFLNTPSTSSPWMLQYGGHHYGANIAYNQGRVVATTPHFLALEPLTFTANGNTYSPLADERNALAAMLASLSASQLATAKLNTTFSDTTMSPGESNGGNGNFPATKVGLAVSSLSDAQKLLVLAAMKPWVMDMDDTVAAKLLSIYESELNGTFIAFTGNGVAGDETSFLVSNTNYARIDGPSVWIEFVCQSGIIYRNQIHYHSVWRDHVRDYGKDLSLTEPLDTTAAGTVSATSAASFTTGSIAPGSIVTLFGNGLASAAASASTSPLPTSLGGVQVQVKDAAGAPRTAPLFYVSPTQITFQNPSATAAGAASISVTLNGTPVGQGAITVAAVSPGLFTANANGQGVAAATVVRVAADGTQTNEAIVQWNTATSKFDAVPIDLGPDSNQLFLITYGTGFANRSALANVTATIGGVAAPVSFAGAHPTLTGVDQANIQIPRSLAGRGTVDVILTVDGVRANTVTINVK